MPKFATKSSTPVARKPVARKFHFTKKAIEALPVPAGEQRVYFRDDQVRGLTVAISPAGKRTFVLYRKIAGRPERITIGTFPDTTVEQARGKASELNGEIAAGENPAVCQRAIREEITFKELFDTYLLLFAKEHKRTWKKDEAMFRLYLHPLRLRKLSSIRKSDLIVLHAHIGRTRGHYIANRVIELVSSMFNRARNDWGYEGENPAAGIKSFKEYKRERFIDGGELPRFFAALAEEPNTTIRDYVATSLLTGARRSNVQAMRWDEINWNRGEWLPASKAKGDEPIRIALAAAALGILARRREDTASEWVFPGTGVTGHLIDPKATWKRILERAGLTDLRLHDLRRTLGSWQAAGGASLQIIGKSLGHADGSPATHIYSRLNMDPVRESVSKAVDAMLLVGGAKGLLGE